jgi:membrane associated rhomboid family serine protease
VATSHPIFSVQDETRRPSQVPIVNLLIIRPNVIAFLLEPSGGDAFVNRWSAVPADIVAGRHLVTILTSMFIRGSWSHIIGNMIVPWAFGPALTLVFTRLRFSRPTSAATDRRGCRP